MRTNVKTWLSTVAVVAALAGGPALYAYAQTPNPASGGGMQHGMADQGGMMNMMQEMSQMMATCNKMMEDMAQHHGSEKPQDRAMPEEQG
ncbi:MAG: hypothetical protein R3F54_31465 [Alphaproteobacteria bacterium]